MSLIRIMEKIRFDDRGLVPAITQDFRSGEVLMLAYMNREALEKTLSTGRAHYYSRSRKSLWLKGETSGNFQNVREIYYDCDADTILLKVEQIGVACHTGEKSCFLNPVKTDEGGKDSSPATPFILDRIYRVIESRKRVMPEGSYVALLLKGGLDKILDKVKEESIELMEASKTKDRNEIVHEVADLWFHTLVLLGYKGITLDDVYKELGNRFGVSGIEEKRKRVNCK